MTKKSYRNVHNDLLDAERERQESVFTRLSVFGHAVLETIVCCVNDKEGDIGLGGTGDLFMKPRER